METSGPNLLPGPTQGGFFHQREVASRQSPLVQLSFTGVRASSRFLGEGRPMAHSPTHSGVALREPVLCRPRWGSCSASPSSFPPRLASPYLAGLAGRNPSPKMFAITIAFMNVWNVPPGWKTTYLVSLLPNFVPLCLITHPLMPGVPVGQHYFSKPSFKYLWIHPSFSYQERWDKALKKLAFLAVVFSFFFFS